MKRTEIIEALWNAYSDGDIMRDAAGERRIEDEKARLLEKAATIDEDDLLGFQYEATRAGFLAGVGVMMALFN